MAVMFGSLYDALRSAGAADDKARLAAEEMASSLATSDAVSDLRAEVADIRQDVSSVKKDVGQLRTDVAVLKWMMGFGLALLVAVLGLLLRGAA